MQSTTPIINHIKTLTLLQQHINHIKTSTCNIRRSFVIIYQNVNCFFANKKKIQSGNKIQTNPQLIMTVRTSA